MSVRQNTRPASLGLGMRLRGTQLGQFTHLFQAEEETPICFPGGYSLKLVLSVRYIYVFFVLRSNHLVAFTKMS